jgi:hypothetical protein
MQHAKPCSFELVSKLARPSICRMMTFNKNGGGF